MIRIAEFPYATQPFGITATQDGRIFYADCGAKSIGCIDPSGSHTQLHLPSPADRPFGIAVDSTGQLWLTEWSYTSTTSDVMPAELVSRVDPSSGAYESCPLVGYGTPRTITTTDDGLVWFTLGASLGGLDTEGHLNIYDPDWSSPWAGHQTYGITHSDDGTIWMTVEGRHSGIASFRPASGEWQLFRLPQLLPTMLAASEDGGIWFTSFGGKSLGLLSGGNVVTKPVDWHPFDVAVTQSGVWVTDFSNNRVVQVDPTSLDPTRAIDLGTTRAEPQCLTEDVSGRLWITLQRGSVACVAWDDADLPHPVDSRAATRISEPVVIRKKLTTALRESSLVSPRELDPYPGPLVAKFSEHTSFATPVEPLPVWRYIDLAKLVSMLESQALYFARLDGQLDPFEGSLPVRTFDDDSEHEIPAGVQDRPDLREHLRIMRASLATFRPRALLSCWHVSEYESTAMWDQYSQTGHGIAIRSTTSRLVRSLDDARPSSIDDAADVPPEERIPYYMGLVRYIDYERQLVLPATGLDYLTCKRQSFDHERELRMVILSDTPVRGGQQFACDLAALADRIYVSPKAPPWFFEAVVAVVRRFGVPWTVQQSDLSRDPIL